MTAATAEHDGWERVDRDERVGLYVYAIVPDVEDSLPAGLTGLDEAPVRLVGQGSVAAAVGVITLDRPPGRRADLLAHSRVVEELSGRGPVVPVQFGSVLPDSMTIYDELIEPDLERWTGLLEALHGRRQFNVKGTYNEQAVLQEVVAESRDIAELTRLTRGLPGDTGHGHRVRLGELVARAMELKRQQDTTSVLDLVLPHVVSYSLRPGSGATDHLLDVALLVDDGRRPGFEDALESVAEAFHERLRLQLVGPLPPYDFVDGDWWA